MGSEERSVEYMGVTGTVCEAIKKIKTFAERFLLSSDGVSYRLAKYLVADEGKLKWLGSLADLKLFTELLLCLDGKWSSPGGYAKKFTLKSFESEQQRFGFVWYRRKQNTIVFYGDIAAAESAKLILLSMAGNRLKKASVSTAMGEQPADEPDSQICDPESNSEESLIVMCDDSDRGGPTITQFQLLLESVKTNVNWK